MRRMALLAVTAVLVAVIGTAELTSAQQSKAAKEKPATKAKPAEKKKRNPFRRVPNYFGQIGLSREQRETIYAIQEEYGKKIQELEKQIQELEDIRNKAVREVLTDRQRQELAELQERAKNRREQRRRERAKRKKAARQSASSPDEDDQ